MNWYFIFYLFSVAEKLGLTLNFLGDCFFILTIFALLAYGASLVFNDDSDWGQGVDDGKEQREKVRSIARRVVYVLMPLCVTMYLFEGLIPTKKDMLFIIIGGTVTNFATTNKNVQQLPNDLLVWARTEIKAQTQAVAPELAHKGTPEARADTLAAHGASAHDLLKEANVLIQKAQAVQQAVEK